MDLQPVKVLLYAKILIGKKTIKELFNDKIFGSAGEKIVIENFLQGVKHQYLQYVMVKIM